jgi:hypothetical protein
MIGVTTIFLRSTKPMPCTNNYVSAIHQVKSTNYDNTGNGKLIFLDRHNVDCGSDAAISQFKLVRDQALVSVSPRFPLLL